MMDPIQQVLDARRAGATAQSTYVPPGLADGGTAAPTAAYNLDGGKAGSNFGGIAPINGGKA